MNFAKYLSVITISMLKFMGGPILGLSLKLNWVETAICSVIGMMAMILLIIYGSSFFSKLYKKVFPNRPRAKRFTKLTRLAVKIRKNFGLKGIAFLTPIIFTPPLGGMLVVAFRYEKKDIILQMLLSAVVWSILETLFFYYIKQLIF